MRSSLTSHLVLAGLVAGLASVVGCSSPPATPIFGTGGSSGSGGGSSGTGGSSSGTGGSASGTGGSASGTGGSASGTGGSASGTGGTTGTGGAAGTPDGGGTGGMPPGDGGGTGGMVGGDQITAVRPTAGCGKAPTGTGQQTIMTMGTKPANCADTGGCGPWMYNRNYNVILPAGYVNTKAYPLVYQGPGCGGNDTGVYGLNGAPVIRVGIAPSQLAAVHHATNPNQGCFDDKEGDDSVDWPFYEAVWDRLAGQLCFDQNRVFASGNSSGAWFSNEVGCKYAGDAMHPIRGIMPNTGGLPSQPMYKPTCTNNPMSGIWMGETMDPENAFSNNIFAIERAMVVNKCTMTNYNAANTDPWPVGGDMTCKKVRGCPELYPLIVCLIPGSGHNGHDSLANPAFAQYLGLFTKAPLLTP
jgi:hypothetical protein